MQEINIFEQVSHNEKYFYLDLILVSCSYIGNSPTGFFLDTFLVIVGQKSKKTGKGLIIDDELIQDNNTRRMLVTSKNKVNTS